MNDLVSRQAVKDWLEKWRGYLDDDMIARMQIGTKDIPTDRQWIPCSERLPEEDMTRYLCTYNYSEGVCVDFGLYSDGAWFTTGVTAWMPLPEPYKEESNEKV